MVSPCWIVWFIENAGSYPFYVPTVATDIISLAYNCTVYQGWKLTKNLPSAHWYHVAICFQGAPRSTKAKEREILGNVKMFLHTDCVNCISPWFSCSLDPRSSIKIHLDTRVGSTDCDPKVDRDTGGIKMKEKILVLLLLWNNDVNAVVYEKNCFRHAAESFYLLVFVFMSKSFGPA